MQDIFGIIAVIIWILAPTLYIISIIRWETKPHAFSWFIRSILTGTAFFAQRTQTQDIGTRVLWISCIVTLWTAIYARYRYKMVIVKQDWLYFILSLCWVIIWYLTKTPLWSVIIISATDLLAFIPTFRKVRSDPEGESVWVYGLSAIKFVLALYSFGPFTVIVWLYPAYLVCANGWFVIYTLARRWWLRKYH